MLPSPSPALISPLVFRPISILGLLPFPTATHPPCGLSSIRSALPLRLRPPSSARSGPSPPSPPLRPDFPSIASPPKDRAGHHLAHEGITGQEPATETRPCRLPPPLLGPRGTDDHLATRALTTDPHYSRCRRPVSPSFLDIDSRSFPSFPTALISAISSPGQAYARPPSNVSKRLAHSLGNKRRHGPHP